MPNGVDTLDALFKRMYSDQTQVLQQRQNNMWNRIRVSPEPKQVAEEPETQDGYNLKPAGSHV